jgi:hypothetical protein
MSFSSFGADRAKESSVRIARGHMSSRVSHYKGLISNRNRRLKYGGCEYVDVYRGGNKARLLTPAEVDEFRAHIQRLLDPSLRTQPLMRRSIV